MNSAAGYTGRPSGGRSTAAGGGAGAGAAGEGGAGDRGGCEPGGDEGSAGFGGAPPGNGRGTGTVCPASMAGRAASARVLPTADSAHPRSTANVRARSTILVIIRGATR